MFIDSHAHYEDEKFNEDRAEVFRKAREAGCVAVIDAAQDLATSKQIIEMAEQNPFLYAAVGVHPHEAKGFREEDLPVPEQLAAHPKCVAIGEIGLDYHYNFSDPETQKQVFRTMLRLANKLDLPFVVHDREAHKDTLNILEEENVKGEACLIHCFSGSREMAEIIMKRGYSVSIGGAVTFKNARRIIEALEVIPIDRILLETDAPYMTPEPYRGKRNDSSLIPLVAEKIASVKSLPPEEVLRKTAENAVDFYRLDRQILQNID